MGSYELRQAYKELDEYLEKHPHLKKYQKHIDDAMNKAGDDPAARLKVFNFFLQDNLLELKTEFQLLKHIIDKEIK